MSSLTFAETDARAATAAAKAMGLEKELLRDNLSSGERVNKQQQLKEANDDWARAIQASARIVLRKMEEQARKEEQRGRFGAVTPTVRRIYDDDDDDDDADAYTDAVEEEDEGESRESVVLGRLPVQRDIVEPTQDNIISVPLNATFTEALLAYHLKIDALWGENTIIIAVTDLVKTVLPNLKTARDALKELSRNAGTDEVHRKQVLVEAARLVTILTTGYIADGTDSVLGTLNAPPNANISILNKSRLKIAALGKTLGLVTPFGWYYPEIMGEILQVIAEIGGIPDNTILVKLWSTIEQNLNITPVNGNVPTSVLSGENFKKLLETPVVAKIDAYIFNRGYLGFLLSQDVAKYVYKYALFQDGKRLFYGQSYNFRHYSIGRLVALLFFAPFTDAAGADRTTLFHVFATPTSVAYDAPITAAPLMPVIEQSASLARVARASSALIDSARQDEAHQAFRAVRAMSMHTALTVRDSVHDALAQAAEHGHTDVVRALAHAPMARTMLAEQHWHAAAATARERGHTATAERIMSSARQDYNDTASFSGESDVESGAAAAQPLVTSEAMAHVARACASLAMSVQHNDAHATYRALRNVSALSAQSLHAHLSAALRHAASYGHSDVVRALAHSPVARAALGPDQWRDAARVATEGKYPHTAERIEHYAPSENVLDDDFYAFSDASFSDSDSDLDEARMPDSGNAFGALDSAVVAASGTHWDHHDSSSSSCSSSDDSDWEQDFLVDTGGNAEAAHDQVLESLSKLHVGDEAKAAQSKGPLDVLRGTVRGSIINYLLKQSDNAYRSFVQDLRLHYPSVVTKLDTAPSAVRQVLPGTKPAYTVLAVRNYKRAVHGPSIDYVLLGAYKSLDLLAEAGSLAASGDGAQVLNVLEKPVDVRPAVPAIKANENEAVRIGTQYVFEAPERVVHRAANALVYFGIVTSDPSGSLVNGLYDTPSQPLVQTYGGVGDGYAAIPASLRDDKWQSGKTYSTVFAHAQTELTQQQDHTDDSAYGVVHALHTYVSGSKATALPPSVEQRRADVQALRDIVVSRMHYDADDPDCTTHAELNELEHTLTHDE